LCRLLHCAVVDAVIIVVLLLPLLPCSLFVGYFVILRLIVAHYIVIARFMLRVLVLFLILVVLPLPLWVFIVAWRSLLIIDCHGVAIVIVETTRIVVADVIVV